MYAFIDCWVAKCISESEAISSSSKTASPLISAGDSSPLISRLFSDSTIRSESFTWPIKLPSIEIVLSIKTDCPSAGVIFTSPFDVIIVTSLSPIVMSSAGTANESFITYMLRLGLFIRLS